MALRGALVILVALLAGTGCANESTSRPVGDADDALPAVGCSIVRGEPPELHPIASGLSPYATLQFSACGHLLVDSGAFVDAALTKLERLSVDIGSTFAPTGDWLAVQSSDELSLRALDTGEGHTFAVARASVGFAVDRSGEESHPWYCTDEGLFIVERDGDTRRITVPGLDCPSLRPAAGAPRLAGRGAGDELVVIDAVSGTVIPTGLFVRSGDEPMNEGTAWREDFYELSADGQYVFHQEEVAGFEGDTYSEPLGPAEATLFDVDAGAVVGRFPSRPLPSVRGAVRSIPGRGHGFIWSGPASSFLLTAGGEVRELVQLDVLDFGDRYALAVRGAEVVQIDLATLETRLARADVVVRHDWLSGFRSSRSATAFATFLAVDPESGAYVRQLRHWSSEFGPVDHPASISAEPLWMSDDGRVLAVGNAGSAGLFDAAGDLITTVRWHHGGGTIHEAGDRLLILLRDGTLYVLNPATGQCASWQQK